MDYTDETEDRHLESPEPEFDLEPPPAEKPKRKYTRREKPQSSGQPAGPAPSDNGNGQAETDPYNLDLFRLSQDFAAVVGVKKLLVTVPVKKPSREWFVRTHPDAGFRLHTAVLELREDSGSETYLVAPSLWPGLSSEPTFSPRLLITAINRQGVLFLWPIRPPRAEGKVDGWSRSALDAADEAKSQWVRITANMTLGGYDVVVASGQVAEPEWPSHPFQEIIRIAFKDRLILEWNHPVLRRLRGEI
jgi:hypothetical protein